MTTANSKIADNRVLAFLLIWNGRSLEFLWLLAFAAIPLVIVEPSFLKTEAAIGYAEVPKVVLLRIVTGLMLVIWAFEWAMEAQKYTVSVDWLRKFNFQPVNWIHRLKNWANAQSGRWIVLAAWFFFFTTLLSTVLSGSLEVSVWGDVPAQDGYSFYNIISYLIFFGVVAAHLRTRAQLWRVFGVIVAVGVITGGYATFQALGHDFLGISEETDGPLTGFAGNSIFTAAVLLMTITVSCGMAVISIPDRVLAAGEIKSLFRQSLPTIVMAWIWTLVIAVEMLGLVYTTSRGPWIGTFFALMALVLLAYRIGGWRYFGKTSVMIWLPGTITLAVSQLGISIFDPLLWLGATISLIVFFALEIAIGWRTLGRLSIAGGIAVALLIGVFAMPTLVGESRTAGNVLGQDGQFRSVPSEVLSGTLGGRLTHWDVSWELIRNRPWFEFDDLSLSWLRPLIGYGPDLFRSTYLLRSPADGVKNLPLEPDHAHNFFIHQTVEQGYLGLLSSLGIFVAAFMVGGRQILRSTKSWSPSLKLVLVTLLALIIGRFIEMMVGVARISDLTILWGLFGVLAALPTLVSGTEESNPETQPTPALKLRRRERRMPRLASKNTIVFQPMLLRLAVVAILVGIIGSLIWLKNVTYIRAGIEDGKAVQQFQEGNWLASLDSLAKTIELAPDVTTYRTQRAGLFLNFLLNRDRFREPVCSLQNENAYDVCLALESRESNYETTQIRPFYFRNHLALANSAFNLGLFDEAIRSYQDALGMVPNSRPIYSALGEALLDSGQTDRAITNFEKSLEIGESGEALMLLGLAHLEIGDLQKGIDLISQGIRKDEDKRLEKLSKLKLAEAYIEPLEQFWSLGERPRDYDLQTRKLLGEAFAEFELGRELSESGDYLASVGRLEEAAHNFLLLGRNYWRNGSPDQAKESLLKSVQLSDGGPSASIALKILAEIGRSQVE